MTTEEVPLRIPAVPKGTAAISYFEGFGIFRFTGADVIHCRGRGTRARLASSPWKHAAIGMSRLCRYLTGVFLGIAGLLPPTMRMTCGRLDRLSTLHPSIHNQLLSVSVLILRRRFGLAWPLA